MERSSAKNMSVRTDNKHLLGKLQCYVESVFPSLSFRSRHETLVNTDPLFLDSIFSSVFLQLRETGDYSKFVCFLFFVDLE